MRALVVDDSRAMRSILRRILTEIGYEVIEADNGRTGLDRLLENGPADLALVDWNMPVMDGLEFVRSVRADHAYADMKILMVSTENDPARVARALMVGADDFAMKPFTREVILDKLELMQVPGR